MIIPPHVSLYDALDPIRNDLKILEKDGIQVQYINEFGVNENMIVKGRISFLIADSPGRSEYNRHMGIKARKNCSSCTVDVSERASTSVDILSATYVRRVSQTDMIQIQMEEEKEYKKQQIENSNQIARDDFYKSLRTKYGIDFVKVGLQINEF
jgi:hypothetical protein